jgi:hypothetical protein
VSSLSIASASAGPPPRRPGPIRCRIGPARRAERLPRGQCGSPDGTACFTGVPRAFPGHRGGGPECLPFRRGGSPGHSSAAGAINISISNTIVHGLGVLVPWPARGTSAIPLWGRVVSISGNIPRSRTLGGTLLATRSHARPRIGAEVWRRRGALRQLDAPGSRPAARRGGAAARMRPRGAGRSQPRSRRRASATSQTTE